MLRAFGPLDGSLGNQEIADRTGLPKATVSRITHTLTTLGYLDYLPRLARYAIAPPVLALGHACVRNAGVRRLSLPHMQELAEAIDASVALGARDRLTMIYLDVARGSQTVAFSLDPGARVEIYKTAMGAAFLHALPERDRSFLLQAIAKATGKEWPHWDAQLRTAFAEIDQHGFCIFEGTYDRAMNGVGAALVQPDGAVHAYSCSAPAFQFGRTRILDEIGPRLGLMTKAIANEAAAAR